MSRRLSRRAFLIAVGGAGVGVAAVRRLLEAERDSVLPDAFDDAAARAVGEAYLAAHPDEADEQLLRRLLGLEPGDVRPNDVRRLRAAVHRDYQGSDFVLVEGWYLARTEARLCALSTYG
jgi:NAD(P)-dependent dehydrogenase (short-subunit alcohol dehydrogenase family)